LRSRIGSHESKPTWSSPGAAKRGSSALAPPFARTHQPPTSAVWRSISAPIEAYPDADILVNNVGVYGAKPFEQLTTEDWWSSFSVNVLSGAWLSQHYLARMLARNAGRIIFISSESALQIPAEMIHYGVSKAAQAALARGLAERTRETAVTVNTVLAGPTKSEGVGQFVDGLARARNTSSAEVEKDFFRTTRPTSLLQRFLRPDEVALVVAFLASPLSAAVNGAAVRAEGGVLKGVY
jgi:NAD(P)-dependent dehydrogenase (short-subunit alcohol dehydrogenase family)